MKVTLKTTDPALYKTPALIVFLFKEDRPPLKRRPELAGLRDIIGPRLKSGDFKAEPKAVLTLFPEKITGPERIILVGLGAEKEFGPTKLRLAAALGVRTAMDLNLQSAALLAPPSRGCLEEPEKIIEAAALGAHLGTYGYIEFKTKDEDKKSPLRSLVFLRTESAGQAKARAAVEAARITAQAISAGRDLVNRPANVLYPEALAREARKLARTYGLKIKIIDMAEAKRRGMGAFLGVAQGSANPGRIIILEYQGAGPKTKPVALVGKAITFDSGGLCLKSADNMSTMKTDMAGGAVVLSVMCAAAELKLKKNLVGIVPAAENMPSHQAYRPGDVLKSLSGQTIEVINTDAEGRLILADALTLAGEYHPGAIIDAATLTGACVIALGEKCAGLLSNDPDLIEALKKAGEASGERIWPLPLIEDYEEALKSEVADFKHVGGRPAGAITAALFLKKFVGDTPWAHLDIAGPARTDKAAPDTPKGATGFGIHLLLHYLRGGSGEAP